MEVLELEFTVHFIHNAAKDGVETVETVETGYLFRQGSLFANKTGTNMRLQLRSCCVTSDKSYAR